MMPASHVCNHRLVRKTSEDSERAFWYFVTLKNRDLHVQPSQGWLEILDLFCHGVLYHAGDDAAAKAEHGLNLVDVE